MNDLMRRLLKSTRAAALPMIGFALPVCIAAIGAGIDYGRLYVVKSRLQIGVDAAALAGARSYAVEDASARGRDAQAQAYFDSNFPDAFMGSTSIGLTKTFTKINSIQVTQMTGRATVPMAFMHLFGVQPQTLSVTASAELQPQPLEIMVALDNTGSMRSILNAGRTRMDALKDSMTVFLDVIHQGMTRRADVAIGMIPYASMVNIGATLQKYGVPVSESDGFTNVGKYYGTSSAFPQNPLAWKGCVNNDATINNMSSNVGYQDPGAYDITKILPGEGGNPKLTPFHWMPNTTSVGAYRGSTPSVPADFRSYDTNTNTNMNRRNNLYYLGAKGDMVTGDKLANSPAYRQSFYDIYISLNFNSDPDDDVITKLDGSPWKLGMADPWKVNYSRVPFINEANSPDWSPANTKYGSPVNSPTRPAYSYNMPSPNFMCTEPALELAYGRTRSAYDSYVLTENWPIAPSESTIHHEALLWSYRMLVRDDVFKRTPPTSVKAKRAIVFMTDGEGNVGASNAQTWYNSAYGLFRAKKITPSLNASDYEAATLLRFAKTCEAAKKDGVEVYIIALTTAVGVTTSTFQNCAGANFYQTSNTTQLKLAFQEVATDLIDLHLVQ